MCGNLTDIVLIFQNEEESFYKAFLSVNRSNYGCKDLIPITISGNILKDIDIHSLVIIKGQIRSKDTIVDEKFKVDLYVYVKEISNARDNSTCNDNSINNVFLNGYVCKKPILRTTPSGKQITDILIACNYGKDRTAYIPCIAWGRLARLAGKLNVGDLITIEGRFQCRQYIKKINNCSYEKIAYELSINKLNSIIEIKNKN